MMPLPRMMVRSCAIDVSRRRRSDAIDSLTVPRVPYIPLSRLEQLIVEGTLSAMSATTADGETRPNGARRRRRGTALEQAILQAAIEELIAGGYLDLTMDRVARRAGTNKNAIYRRWPNRAALAIAAYRQMAGSEAPVADTGTLRTDVLATLRGINSDAASPAGVIRRSLVSSIGDDPELRARLLERVADVAATTWLQILGRAVARAEEPQDRMHAAVRHGVRGQVELAEDAAHVRLDRLRGDEKKLGDSAICAPL